MVHDLTKPHEPDAHEPGEHDPAERPAHARRPVVLEVEQRGDDDDGERDADVRELRGDDLEPLHGAEYGDGGGDHPIAIEERPPHETQHHEHDTPRPPRAIVGLLEDQGEEGEHASLAPVVGAQDEGDVLDADDEDQRPDDEGEEAEDVRLVRREPVFGLERLLHGVERARPDVAVDDAERRQRQQRQPLAGGVGWRVMPLHRHGCLDGHAPGGGHGRGSTAAGPATFAFRGLGGGGICTHEDASIAARGRRHRTFGRVHAAPVTRRRKNGPRHSPRPGPNLAPCLPASSRLPPNRMGALTRRHAPRFRRSRVRHARGSREPWRPSPCRGSSDRPGRMPLGPHRPSPG